jgi:hypothetical protein
LPIQIVNDDLPFFAGAGLNPNQVIVCDVQIDNRSIYVDRGSGLRRGFAKADRLVIASYQIHTSTIHLRFDPPVRAVGTCLSADGALGKSFFAQIEVEDQTNNARFSHSVSAIFSDIEGNAPFVGLQGGIGETIQDAWFDVKSDEVNSLNWVAMNQLWILP